MCVLSHFLSTMALEWEAMELTYRALTEFEGNDVSDPPLPDRLTKELLPRFRHGLRIVDVEFRRSQVFANEQRVCDVHYYSGSHPRKSSLESLVWSAVLSTYIPDDVRLCTVETMDEFLRYLYIALGHNRHRAAAAAETIHRSWEEFDFVHWGSRCDRLLTRYAQLRTLVPFPLLGFPPVAVAAGGANRTQRSSSWGLGFLAFFGLCNGDCMRWAEAAKEAQLWFSNDMAYAKLVRLLSQQSFSTYHFPEAMFAMARALFYGDIRAMYDARDLVASVGSVEEACEILSVINAFSSVAWKKDSHLTVPAAVQKPYVRNIGVADKFGECLANRFWMEEEEESNEEECCSIHHHHHSTHAVPRSPTEWVSICKDRLAGADDYSFAVEDADLKTASWLLTSNRFAFPQFDADDIPEPVLQATFTAILAAALNISRRRNNGSEEEAHVRNWIWRSGRLRWDGVYIMTLEPLLAHGLADVIVGKLMMPLSEADKTALGTLVYAAGVVRRESERSVVAALTEQYNAAHRVYRSCFTATTATTIAEAEESPLLV